MIYGGFFLGIVLWFGVFGGLADVFAERVEPLPMIFIIAIVWQSARHGTIL